MITFLGIHPLTVLKKMWGEKRKKKGKRPICVRMFTASLFTIEE